MNKTSYRIYYDFYFFILSRSNALQSRLQAGGMTLPRAPAYAAPSCAGGFSP
jgi:hypothetical protein